MSAHTPGPWAVGGGTGMFNQVAIDPSIGCAYGAGDEVVANARLMAASPEMLATLIYVREMIESGKVLGMSRINAAIRLAQEKS